MRKLLSLFVVLALAACSGEASKTTKNPNGNDTGITSSALTCEDEPIQNSDGTATMVGCSFYQQDFNITHHGTELSKTGLSVTAGSTTQAGLSVTHRCGKWLLGKDAQGVEVFVSTETGEVRSHGTMHPGNPVSALPSTLALPIQVQ